MGLLAFASEGVSALVRASPLPKWIQQRTEQELSRYFRTADVAWAVPTVVIPGTGVMERIGFIPVAELVYIPLRMCCGRNVVAIVPPRAGTGSLEPSYQHVAQLLLKESETTQINVVGHSQGAEHALRFAGEYPERVAVCIAVGGPNAGSWLASLLLRVFGFMPWPVGRMLRQTLGCITDLAIGSEYLRMVTAQVQDMLDHPDLVVRPRIVCISVGGERLVRGHRAFVRHDHAVNILLARQRPDWLRWEKVEFQQTRTGADHLSELMNDEVLAVVVQQLSLGPSVRVDAASTRAA